MVDFFNKFGMIMKMYSDKNIRKHKESYYV